MKTLLFALLLFVPVFCWAGTEPNPGDYTIAVHVQSSRLVGQDGNIQRLSVTIDGKKYKLEAISQPRYDLLRVGDYKARVVKDDASRSYEYFRAYQFLFPDGKTRRYTVVGESE